jgi:hypothetical protein
MTSIKLPAPLNERLDRLVERAKAEGVAATRKTVLWALIAGAPVDAERLAAMVRGVIKAEAGDAAEGLEPKEILVDRRHAPGPRARQGHERDR